MKVLVLGVTGMLGSAVFKVLSNRYDVWGTLRNHRDKSHFSLNLQRKIISSVDVLNQDDLVNLLSVVKPDVVINCVGLVKQLATSKDPLVALPINAMFPHRLAHLCSLSDTRVVHISTDCVFTGSKGLYVEQDVADSVDLYGVSKWLGEVDYPNAITLRTSIIGHELHGNRSLIDWFLSQKGEVSGFSRAIFSGLPTIEVANIIGDFVIPNAHLTGLYHLSASPINKYDLLCLVSKVYKKEIKIIKDVNFKIDRSLDSSLFQKATGFLPSPWPALVQAMYSSH